MCHTFLKILLLGGDWGKDVVGMWPYGGAGIFEICPRLHLMSLLCGCEEGEQAIKCISREKSEGLVPSERALRVSAALQK